MNILLALLSSSTLLLAVFFIVLLMSLSKSGNRPRKKVESDLKRIKRQIVESPDDE